MDIILYMRLILENSRKIPIGLFIGVGLAFNARMQKQIHKQFIFTIHVYQDLWHSMNMILLKLNVTKICTFNAIVCAHLCTAAHLVVHLCCFSELPRVLLNKGPHKSKKDFRYLLHQENILLRINDCKALLMYVFYVCLKFRFQ